MSASHHRRTLAMCLALTAAGAAGGCTNPDTPSVASQTTRASSPGTAGEPAAPPPRSAAAQAPSNVQRTPQAALIAFATVYANWSYRTLTAEQRSLAAMSVGAARLAERQAAATSQGDATISRGRIHNSGQVVSVGQDMARGGQWVVVTRERTGGDTQYEGLAASYHVTLAQLAAVAGGYAVSEWLPQS